MVYNGILMETIGISVMVSIGLLLFFLAGLKTVNYQIPHVIAKGSYYKHSMVVWSELLLIS